MNDKHIIQLDGIRFFAVLMVMIAHWAQWQWTNPILINIPFVHGVTLFFVLSGFLITRILITNRDKYQSKGLSQSVLIKNFYIRRFFRIFPIYYLLIFLLFAIDYKNTRELFPWLITYTSNIYQSVHNTYVGDFNHFWSLAVEEQFYMFWPLVILFIKPNKTYLTIVGTIILAMLVRTHLYFNVGKWMATAYFTLSCMHALGIGALLAYVTIYKNRITDEISRPIYLYASAVIYIGLLAINSYYNIGWYKEIFDELLFSIVAALIILRASTNGFTFALKYLLENKFVTYSGKISYGLYVYHLFIPTLFYFISPRLGISISNKYTAFVAFYFLTFLVAHLSWKIIENPINKIKEKVPYLK